jgi:hypothetical protein
LLKGALADVNHFNIGTLTIQRAASDDFPYEMRLSPLYPSLEVACRVTPANRRTAEPAYLQCQVVERLLTGRVPPQVNLWSTDEEEQVLQQLAID